MDLKLLRTPSARVGTSGCSLSTIFLGDDKSGDDG
jgi:hypothetical protein